MPVETAQTFDYREAARFVISGVIATLGNMLAAWLTRPVMEYRLALLCGVATGMVISFVLSKFYAFRSREMHRSGGELLRFLLVYGLGVAFYFVTALAARTSIANMGFGAAMAEMGGVFFGASTMAVSGYLGHRFFTYRTHQSVRS